MAAVLEECPRSLFRDGALGLVSRQNGAQPSWPGSVAAHACGEVVFWVTQLISASR